MIQLNKIQQLLIKGKISSEEAVKLLKEEGEKSQNDNITENSSQPYTNLERAMNKLNSLVGLKKIKKLIIELQAYIKIQKRRKEAGLKADSMVLHMIFKGNPGTGKTTVARALGNIFREMNILEKGHLIEVERADLVGEYVGHTAQKTKKKIRQAMEGILFIDEAYSLARGGEKDFGREAIDTLVKAMEDNNKNLMLILAGYRDEMNLFLQSNPGLKSRFPIMMDFPDYSVKELIKIAELMTKEREYRLSSDAKIRLETILKQRSMMNEPNSGNARVVRNIIEKSLRNQALRLVQKDSISKKDLLMIEKDDLDEL